MYTTHKSNAGFLKNIIDRMVALKDGDSGDNKTMEELLNEYATWSNRFISGIKREE